MVEPSKKRKGSTSTTTIAGQHCHDTFGDAPTPPNPSLSSPRSLTLFSSDEKCRRYYSLFSNLTYDLQCKKTKTLRFNVI